MVLVGGEEEVCLEGGFGGWGSQFMDLTLDIVGEEFPWYSLDGLGC